MKAHISKPKELEKKIGTFTKTNFHIISDFDKTLTKAFVEGRKIQSTYSLIRDGKYLTPAYYERAHALFEEYHPYEIAQDISVEERDRKLKEWWSKHFSLMMECGMNREVFSDIIRSKRLQLREGSSAFFALLSRHNIPLLIFSAGVGDLITEFLQAEKLLTPNVHVVSNFYDFDEHGHVVGLKGNIIHTFNKHEVEITNTPYYKEIAKKKNAILLGDSLGDLGMSEGLRHDAIVKIGFLNENKEAFLQKYTEHFDVIILDDGPMEYVTQLLKEIITR